MFIARGTKNAILPNALPQPTMALAPCLAQQDSSIARDLRAQVVYRVLVRCCGQDSSHGGWCQVIARITLQELGGCYSLWLSLATCIMKILEIYPIFWIARLFAQAPHF